MKAATKSDGQTYLGDGAYAEIDRWGSIILTTTDGIRDTNRIVLEPQVWADLLRLVARAGGEK